MALDTILAGVRRFQDAEYPKRKDLFTGLANGQSRSCCW